MATDLERKQNEVIETMTTLLEGQLYKGLIPKPNDVSLTCHAARNTMREYLIQEFNEEYKNLMRSRADEK